MSRSLSVRTRFEVFKRDGFTCQYCGRGVPDVTLEADHVIPKVEGGGDELENLLTACWDCNRGKAGVPLEVTAPMLDMSAQTELIREREKQLRAYNAAKAEQRGRADAAYEEVYGYWFDTWGVTELKEWHVPWEATLRRASEDLGVEEVKEAMDVTAAKFQHISSDAVRYLGGILKWKRLELAGRLAFCTVCSGRIELTPEQAAQTGKWHHSTCEESPIEVPDSEENEVNGYAHVEPGPYVETEPEPDSVEWHELHPFGDAEIGV